MNSPSLPTKHRAPGRFKLKKPQTTIENKLMRLRNRTLTTSL